MENSRTQETAAAVSISFVSNWREMYGKTVEVLLGPAPIFYGRIGGSDTDAVIDYLEGTIAEESPSHLLARVLPHRNRLGEFNGFYDKSDNDENLLRFCELMLACYRSFSHASLVGGKWQTRYFKSNLNPRFHVVLGSKAAVYDRFLELIAADKRVLNLYPFSFIEKTTRHKWSMFNAFREILPGRRVLVISPFSASIEKNFIHRRHFFRNYDYPEFHLVTYNTPITYKGLPEDYYPHLDWFHTVKAMKADVEKIDFDIALLACGSYAMPLGTHIAGIMKRKAVYVGGILQLYFGIMGRRYQNVFYTDQINADYFMTAEEASKYTRHISVAENARKDGFGAYF